MSLSLDGCRRLQVSLSCLCYVFSSMTPVIYHISLYSTYKSGGFCTGYFHYLYFLPTPMFLSSDCDLLVKLIKCFPINLLVVSSLTASVSICVLQTLVFMCFSKTLVLTRFIMILIYLCSFLTVIYPCQHFHRSVTQASCFNSLHWNCSFTLFAFDSICALLFLTNIAWRRMWHFFVMTYNHLINIKLWKLSYEILLEVQNKRGADFKVRNNSLGDDQNP